MSAYFTRREDLLNQHIDSLLHDATAPTDSTPEMLPDEMEEMLEVAGLLAGTMGVESPDPAARAAGLERLLTAARKQPPARILLFPTVAHRNGKLPQATGRATRSEVY